MESEILILWIGTGIAVLHALYDIIERIYNAKNNTNPRISFMGDLVMDYHDTDSKKDSYYFYIVNTGNLPTLIQLSDFAVSTGGSKFMSIAGDLSFVNRENGTTSRRDKLLKPEEIAIIKLFSRGDSIGINFTFDVDENYSVQQNDVYNEFVKNLTNDKTWRESDSLYHRTSKLVESISQDKKITIEVFLNYSVSGSFKNLEKNFEIGSSKALSLLDDLEFINRVK